MALDDIDVVHIQPGQALIHTPRDPLRAEVKHVLAVPPHFRGQHKLLPGDVLERFA